MQEQNEEDIVVRKKLYLIWLTNVTSCCICLYSDPYCPFTWTYITSQLSETKGDMPGVVWSTRWCCCCCGTPMTKTSWSLSLGLVPVPQAELLHRTAGHRHDVGRTGDLSFCHCTEAKLPALSGSQMHEHSQEIDEIQEELVEELWFECPASHFSTASPEK